MFHPRFVNTPGVLKLIMMNPKSKKIKKKSKRKRSTKSSLEEEEDKMLLKLAEKRLKDYESGKLKLVSHKDAWK